MFNENKLFGIGPRMFRFLCDDEKYIYIYDSKIQFNNNGSIKYSDGKPVIKDYNVINHPHNILAQIISETGLIDLYFIFIY